MEKLPKIDLPKIKIPDLIPLLTFRSKWANEPIDIDEPLNSPHWADAGTYSFSKGFLLAKNDTKFLYLALDVTGDTGNDTNTNDYFWLSFDYDRNKSITANKDVNYGLYPNQPNRLGRQFYLGPNVWTGLLNSPSPSEVRMEFGSSEQSATPHRIWKFKILLSEINVNIAFPFVNPFTYLGFRVKSQTPSFTVNVPENFSADFSKLKKLELARKPSVVPADLGPVIGSIGLIPTTKIVAGRATTASGYYVHVTNAAFGGTLNFIGNRTLMSSLYAAGNRRYRVSFRGPGAAAFQPAVAAWTNYVWDGSDYVLKSFSGIDGIYQLEDPSKDFSIDDLLIQFPTSGLQNGDTTFKVEFLQGATNTVVESQSLQLFIDNRMPNAIIETIRHGSAEVATCAIETLAAAPDGLNFNITANDPEGNLLSVSFSAQAGSGHSYSLYQESYSAPMGNWTGFTNKLVPATGNWRPPHTCSYNFTLTAWARTTNGYGYIGHNQSFKGLAIIL